MKIVAVIPAYNEAATIRGVALRTLAVVPEVIVVNDGSQDGTVAALEGVGITLVSNPVNLGKGASLARGFALALAEGADAVVTPVADYMTAAPECLGPDSELADAAQLMLGLGIRHLPIVRGGLLVGVLSIRDVLDAGVHPAEGSRAG